MITLLLLTINFRISAVQRVSMGSELAKKDMVKAFLRPMIESGSQRAEFDQIVNQFTSKFEELGAFNELLAEVVSTRSTCIEAL
jgi:hypothetical protein